jgi:hypothetical protein
MRRFALLGVALLTTLLLAAPAAAAKPVPGSGSYVVDDIFGDECPDGGGIPLVVTGVLDGCAYLSTSGKNGSDKATFEGTAHLDGYPPMEGTALIDFSKTDRFSLKGTGDLRGLHGQGAAVDDDPLIPGLPPISGIFEGQFHVDQGIARSAAGSDTRRGPT